MKRCPSRERGTSKETRACLQDGTVATAGAAGAGRQIPTVLNSKAWIKSTVMKIKRREKKLGEGPEFFTEGPLELLGEAAEGEERSVAHLRPWWVRSTGQRHT